MIRTCNLVVAMMSTFQLSYGLLSIKVLFFGKKFCFASAGSLKSWERSIDLVNVLKLEIRDGQLSFRGKKILEVMSIDGTFFNSPH